MKKIVIILVLVLVVAEFFAWRVYKSNKEEPEVTVNETKPHREEPKVSEQPKEEAQSLPEDDIASYSGMGNTDSDSFPPPSTEVVNGRTERTIHMGVRQYVWEPNTITAKKGELVRLIIHNADVKHGLVIPDLGVMEGDIPPEGAVIEFTASKVGTFEFFCSVYCGEGHMEMRGKVVIE